MKTKQTFLIMAISLMALAASAQLQYITNISVAQRTDLSGLVDVNFDLVALPADNYIISFSVSFDTGTTFNYVLREFLTGDIGPISPGTGYHIVWDGLGSFPETYGPQSQLKIYAVSCPESVTDIDGNEYLTVPIGGQCWMKENLKTIKYRNGNSIAYPGSDNNAWANNTTGAYAWYDNDISWKDSYGALYNWHAVNNTAGLCPTGWHVPTDAEWTKLTDFVGSAYYGDRRIKSCRQVNSPLGGDCATSEHPRWNENNTHYGNDLIGFSALPGGYRDFTGSFAMPGFYGYWWSSTEYSTTHAYTRNMNFHTTSVFWLSNNKRMGISVRCLKD